MGEGEFSNAGQLLNLREERRDRQKIWYDVNSAKLKEISEDINRIDHCLIPHTRNTGVCINLWVAMATGTLLVATDFCDFYARNMMLPPLIFIATLPAEPHPLMYIT